jgi:hypothetical protein
MLKGEFHLGKNMEHTGIEGTPSKNVSFKKRKFIQL